MIDARTLLKRRRFWRAVGATIIALVLWGILSLSQTYTWDIDVPLYVHIDTTRQALGREIPSHLRVTARGDGWNLMQTSVGEGLSGHLDPEGRQAGSNDSTRTFSFTERDLINSIDAPSSIRIDKVVPPTLQLVVTDLVTKQVPLYYPDITIRTREGFQVIGTPVVRPDSVSLSGSREAIRNINGWYTKPLDLHDIFAFTRTTLPVSDSLRGVVHVQPDEAVVTVDVQEVAEVVFEDLQVVNRSASADTTVRLQYFPDRITVTLRGGARELGKLEASDIVPQIELVAGVDTTGYTRPVISLPKDLNASIIDIEPERIRYIWHKTAVGTSGE